jgi:hypothetical protein
MVSSDVFRSRAGSTLLEAAFATAIAAIFFAGIYAINGRTMNMLRRNVECTAATTALQNRLERVRSATWEQITDSTYLRDMVLAPASSSAPYLNKLSEKITLNAYPEPLTYSQGTLAQSTIEVTRAANGRVTTTAGGDGTLATGKAIRVDFSASWQPSGTGTTQTRRISTFVTQGGIIGRNQ